MADISIIVDDKTVKAQSGDNVLWAALDAGIYIPHLCAIRGVKRPSTSCRLCFVEVEGYPSPVPSCTIEVKEGMKVRTRSPRVDRLVRSAFELIMSCHRLDCKDCPGNKKCKLQEISKTLKIPLKQKRHSHIEPEYEIDESREDFGLNPNHCVLCGKCVWVCNEKVKCGILDFANRGMEIIVSTFDGRPLAEQEECNGCLECVRVCPVGALYIKDK